MRASGAFDVGPQRRHRGVPGRRPVPVRAPLPAESGGRRRSASAPTACATAIDDTVALLGTPAGALIKPILLRDPTGETRAHRRGACCRRARRAVEDGVWVSRSAPRARAGRDDACRRRRPRRRRSSALAAIRRAFAPQRGARPAPRAVRRRRCSASQSRAQIKGEVERLAIAGSVVIVALLLVAFGSLRALGIAVLPVATGVLAGIAAVSLGFGQVHGVTLGFGTTLIGEAVDYAIYYLIQARGAPAGAGWQRWRASSWPTVRLGLLTSLCGFAALVFSGFPGLAQLGVFSIAGLVAAAFDDALRASRCWPRTARPASACAVGSAGFAGARRCAAAARARGRCVVARRRRRSSRCWLLPSPWRGDLPSLSPVRRRAARRSTPSCAPTSARPMPARWSRVAGADEATALAGAEAAGARLDALVEAGALDGYDIAGAPAAESRRRRRARRAALPDAADARSAPGRRRPPTARCRRRASSRFIADVQARAHAADRSTAPRSPARRSRRRSMRCCCRGDDGRPWRAARQPAGRRREALDAARCAARSPTLPDARVVAHQAPSSMRSTRATCAKRCGRRRSARSRSRCCSRAHLRSRAPAAARRRCRSPRRC